MKVRSDFVSNSSSSSFIIAYDYHDENDVFDAIAKQCLNVDDPENGTPNLYVKNKRILDFCANTFQLLYVGDLVVMENDVTYVCDPDFDPAINKHTPDTVYLSEKQFKSFLNKIKTAKAASSSSTQFSSRYMKDKYGDDVIVDSTHIIHHEVDVVNDLVVSNEQMDAIRNKGFYICDETKMKLAKERTKNIFNLAKNKYKSSIKRYLQDIRFYPCIYCITEDTLSNTKDLIDAGYTVKTYAEWENLDLLRKKLDEDKKILCLKISDSGDGAGDFHILDESGTYDLKTIEGVELLGTSI